MTNGEKYKTVEERLNNFDKWCSVRNCNNCELGSLGKKYGMSKYGMKGCGLSWLELEYKEELKPCPFCGSKDIDYFETDFGRADDPFYYVVKCEDCNANIYAKSGALEDAIVLWNKRKENEVKE